MEAQNQNKVINQPRFYRALSTFENQTGRNHPLAASLRALRKMSGQSQEGFSFNIGFSREWVSHVENGYDHAISNLNIDVVIAWCSICKEKMVIKGLTKEVNKCTSVVSNYFQQKLSTVI
jgi:transcriptional regulator with XRE-family HTH domain